jgi:hypothetical protein
MTRAGVKPERRADYDDEWNWLLFGFSFLLIGGILLFGLARWANLADTIPTYLAVVFGVSLACALTIGKWGLRGWDVVLRVLDRSQWGG